MRAPRIAALVAGGLILLASLAGCSSPHPAEADLTAAPGSVVALHPAGSGSDTTLNVIFPAPVEGDAATPQIERLGDGTLVFAVPLGVAPGEYTVTGLVDGDPIDLTIRVP